MIAWVPAPLRVVSRQEAPRFCTDVRHALPCRLPCEVCAAECATAASMTVTVTRGDALLRRSRRIARPFAHAN